MNIYITYERNFLTEKQINAITDRCNQKETKQIRENVNLNDMNNKKIIDVDVVANINKESKLNSSVLFEGDLELKRRTYK